MTQTKTAPTAPPVKLIEPFQRLGYLRYLGPHAKTIIDIGVQGGTPALYRAFSDRDFILVDPFRDNEALMTSKPERYRFYGKGLASKPGKMKLNAARGQSSLLQRNDGFLASIEDQYEVPLVTFKDMLKEMKPKGPFGVKIDTEGFELEIVKGMEGCFDQVEFLICEMSVRNIYAGSYSFGELAGYLASKGMHFFNFLNDFAPQPRYYDVVFLRANDPKFGARDIRPGDPQPPFSPPPAAS